MPTWHVRRWSAAPALALVCCLAAGVLPSPIAGRARAGDEWPPASALQPQYYGPLRAGGEKVLLVLGWVQDRPEALPLGGHCHLSLYRVHRLPAPIWVRRWEENVGLAQGFQVLSVAGARSRLVAVYTFGVDNEGITIYAFGGKDYKLHRLFSLAGKIPPLLAREGGRYVMVERDNVANMGILRLPLPLPAWIHSHVFVRRTYVFSARRQTFVRSGTWEPDRARERKLTPRQWREERAAVREAIRNRQTER